MSRFDWFVIFLLVAIVVGGGLWERLPAGQGLLPGEPMQQPRRNTTTPSPAPAPGIDADAFARQVPAPPAASFRPNLVIEGGVQPRRGGSFIGTAWALSGSDAWLSARHVTDGCRQLSFLAGPRLPAATGHPSADVSAIPIGRRNADGLELSRDPLTTGEEVYLVGFPAGDAAAVYGTVSGTGVLDHRSLGHRETVVVVAQRKRVPSGSAELGGISGGPVLDADGNVVGTVIGGAARRARSIISVERNVAWLAATAGGATSASLGSAGSRPTVTPSNFAQATAPLLANGPVRVVRCDR